ncbi:hypothetical protein [Myceligenerans crystallogenes]|uniref:Uncharacterized protein n=1 Tax=Myceligenerans crystallogenes TaxID=316335 RepID=A0ABN2NMX7_9MICO
MTNAGKSVRRAPRLAIYVAVHSRWRDTPPRLQEVICRDFAELDGYAVEAVYTDHPARRAAESKSRYDAFARMVADAENDRFDAVAVCDRSRFPDDADLPPRLFDAVDVVVRFGPTPPLRTSSGMRAFLALTGGAIALLGLQAGLARVFTDLVAWITAPAVVMLLALLARATGLLLPATNSTSRTGTIITLFVLTAATLTATARSAALPGSCSSSSTAPPGTVPRCRRGSRTNTSPSTENPPTTTRRA